MISIVLLILGIVTHPFMTRLMHFQWTEDYIVFWATFGVFEIIVEILLTIFVFIPKYKMHKLNYKLEFARKQKELESLQNNNDEGA